MSFRVIALVLCVGSALAVFSQSDIDFLNGQKNYETKLQQAKIDCDQRIRDIQDSLTRERDTLNINLTTQSSQQRQCAGDLQRFQGSQVDFLMRFGQLIGSNPSLSKLISPGSLDANGRIVDLNAAYDILVVLLRNGDQSQNVETLRREVASCRADVTRFQVVINETTSRMNTAETRANECLNRISGNDSTLRTQTTQLTTITRDLQTCQADSQNLRRTADDATSRIRQIEISLNTCTQSQTSNGQDSKTLRGKMQFLYDISGYCRQNFFNLANDKTALSSAFADLNAFVSQMGPLTAVPGGLEEKITFLGNERNSFRRRVEMINVILSSLFNKVDDYTRVLRTDGYDNLTSGNGQGTYGSWVFNPASDGVDINNLTTIDSCKSAVVTLKEKISTVSNNLNTALRNNNECLKKFNESSSVTLIGAGFRDEY